MTEHDEETKEPMIETTTPSKDRSRRRSLALPPRGQTLSRLQDLEADGFPSAVLEEPKTAAAPIVNDAVNTARSNAVHNDISTQVLEGGSNPSAGHVAEVSPTPRPVISVPLAPHISAPASPHRPAARAAREPTTRITVDMPDSLHRQISMLSAETRRSIKELVIEALEATYFGGKNDSR